MEKKLEINSKFQEYQQNMGHSNGNTIWEFNLVKNEENK